MAHSLKSVPGRLISSKGRTYRYFGGTAYLGLQAHPPFRDLFLENVEKYGMHYGASRKSNVALEVYPQAEARLASWMGSGSSLCMSSGFLAAQLVIQTLLGRGHSLFLAPNAHPALNSNGVDPSVSYAELELKIKGALDKGGPLPVLLFDTVALSGGFYPHFEALKGLPLERLILVADDSHGIGIVGREGRGCHEILLGLKPAKLLVCCSLGKAMGVQVGGVFAGREDTDMLRETAFFGGASPPSPALMGCLLHAQDLYVQRREKLMENYALFMEVLEKPAFFDHLPGHPTFEFGNSTLATALEDKGFVITNFHYPNAQGPLVGRIVLSAHHHKEDILALANCLNGLLA